MSETVIKVENLSKQYRIGAKEGYKTFRETLIDSAKAPFLLSKKIAKRVLRPLPSSAAHGRESQENTIWALKDISFEVKQGEVLGIIGRNGAGKTTLLKVLSRITEPTRGRVELRGRVGSLLEVGTGFHPELSGHENIYLYGAILGMDRWEVSRKFNKIVTFAGLEKFVDTPVKRYSSGMYMRLAFAVAAHLEPEILLVDEVLAVGDLEFQKKCLGKMEDVAQREGRTVLFVSHNLAAVRSLCPRALIFDAGRIRMDRDSKDCIEWYVNKSLSHIGTADLTHFRKVAISPDTPAFFKRVHVLGSKDAAEILPVFASGDDIEIELEFEVRRPIRDATLTLIFSRTTGETAATVFSGDQGVPINLLPPKTTYRCRLKEIPLTPGTYQADIGFNQTAVSQAYDVLLGHPIFTISQVPQTGGQFAHRPWGAFYWDQVQWEKVVP